MLSQCNILETTVKNKQVIQTVIHDDGI